MPTFSLRPVKEPRGFIRILQILLAIVTFALVVDYESQSTVTITPPTNGTAEIAQADQTWNIKISYPFSSHREKLSVENPTNNSTYTLYAYVLPCSAQPSAEFVVATGVITMLACFFLLPFYICRPDFYEDSTSTATIELSVTLIMSLLWFISACAWTSAVRSLMHSTWPDELITLLEECGSIFMCQSTEYPVFKKLHVSVAFAFLSAFVCLSSSWFVYKDARSSRLDEPISPQAGLPQYSDQTGARHGRATTTRGSATSGP